MLANCLPSSFRSHKSSPSVASDKSAAAPLSPKDSIKPKSPFKSPGTSQGSLVDKVTLKSLESKSSISYSSPALSPGIGWGKVVQDGKNLSVTTFGLGSPKSSKTGRDYFSAKAISTTERLAALRKLMKEEPDGGLDYYVIPSEDAHQSEFVNAADRRREYITGFSGTAGLAVVSRSEAYLFTDSRYHIQAVRELDSNWTLHKVGLPGVKPWNEWLVDRPRGSRCGIDSRLISHETARALTSALDARSSRLVFPRLNLIDQIWKDRPARGRDPIFIQDLKYAGKPANEKLSEIRAWIRSQRPPQPVTKRTDTTTTSASKSSQPPTPGKSVRSFSSSAITIPSSTTPVATLVSNLSSIAWILNIRGQDVPFNPVVQAYLFCALNTTILFVDKSKVTKEVDAYLKDLGVTVKEYGDVWNYLRRTEWGQGKVLVDPKSPYAVSLMLTSLRYTIAPSEIELNKAIKNEVEIQGFRNAYLRDGVAMVRWFAWLEEKIRKSEPISEWGAAEKLTEFRAEGELYRGLSGENISASGANAALPHYNATRASSSLIDTQSPYLIDGGGQYLDGTIDTTRTVHFGTPTPEQMEAFTRVLQGHIAIDTAYFPEGTTGAQLDVLARKALWKDGLNYLHGTGHGIGSFLNVHEGPQAFGANVPLKIGMVLSNEPGFYKEGHYGIRIESALVVQRVKTKGKFGGDVWLGFERFTMVPIQTKMVRMELLTKEERCWLKDHNNLCRTKLIPLLEAIGDKTALKWLRRDHRGPATAAGVSVEWD